MNMGSMIVEIEDRLMAGQSVKDVARATKTSKTFVEGVRQECFDSLDAQMEQWNRTYDEYVEEFERNN